MKKILFVLMLGMAIILSIPSYAEGTCTDGKTIMGKNGKTYCVSNITMNWWTAFSWCKTQGRHLVTIHEACDTNEKPWDGAYGTGACYNLIGTDFSLWCWSAIPYDENYIYLIAPASGGIGNVHYWTSFRNLSNPALCL